MSGGGRGRQEKRGLIEMDMIAAMNLVFCMLIVILGYVGYRQSRRISKVLYRLPLFIGMAFGLFGISHFVTVIGMGGALADVLVVVRALGYIVVIASMAWAIGASKKLYRQHAGTSPEGR
jgi:ABC-type uncharacterized transport system YnjBCD permease subunit